MRLFDWSDQVPSMYTKFLDNRRIKLRDRQFEEPFDDLAIREQ